MKGVKKIFIVTSLLILITCSKDDGYGAVISENPGKSIGVVGCGVAIAFFPPAAAVCALTVATGAVVDEIDN